MMSVYHNGEIFNRLENVEIGSAANGKFSGRIAGLPAGGPYTVELSIGKGGEKKCYKDILVGDLWLLAGQSNMADSGFMPSCSEVDPMVHAFYMTDNWGVAEDPLHDTAHAVAPVHGGNPANPYGKRLRGTGPGLPFGLAMYKKSGVPQGLIALAHGGTSLAQWDPELLRHSHSVTLLRKSISAISSRNSLTAVLTRSRKALTDWSARAKWSRLLQTLSPARSLPALATSR
jgi:hypothetical protein